MKIFVYGTLKRDGALHKLVKDAKYLGVDKLHKSSGKLHTQ